ncbi:hypothetical protein Tco_1053104, partial [Tanacetum coccineum]
MPRILIPLRPILGVLQIGGKNFDDRYILQLLLLRLVSSLLDDFAPKGNTNDLLSTVNNGLVFRQPDNVVVWVLPCNSHCISPGYSVAISLVLVLPLGAVVLEVAWSPALKANDGIGICPLGSWVIVVMVVVVIVVAVVVAIVIAVVVVVICSCRPAPTVLGQVAKLLAV